MNLGIEGKRALVLGGSRGLGLAIAEGLAAEGVRTLLVGRDAERLAEATARIPHSASLTADLADASAAKAVVEAAMQRLGGVDILINNTGGPPPSAALGMSAEAWTAQFQAMVVSIITVTEQVVADMRTRGWGRILTITSSGVLQPIPNLAVSNTLRAALLAWSKTLAAEVASDGITCNVLVPGRIDTERVRFLDAAAAKRQSASVEEVARTSAAGIPVGRYGEPKEFAAPAVFLAGEPASYVTGSVIRIDGGMIRSI